MFSYTVLPQEGGRRTVRFLEKMLPEAPSGLLYRFLRTKKIRVNRDLLPAVYQRE